MLRLAVLFSSLLALHPASLLAGEGSSQSGSRDLFHPVPRASMRAMSTDRPDKTESPFTIDAGRVQVESDIANFSRDRHNSERSDTRVESWAFGTTTLRIGVLPNAELNVIVEPWTSTRTVERPGGVTRVHGFGDLTLRTKINLWGNDGGSTAFGFLPFVKVPTSQGDAGNHSVEGGLILPLSIELPGDFEVGLMTEIDFSRDEAGSGHHAEWINSISLSRDLSERVVAFIEFFSQVSAQPRTPWIGTLDFGFAIAVSKNVQLDAGANLGLTRAADDVNPFVGISVRF